MKPTQWIKEIRERKLNAFPIENYVKSCLIYSKARYGIFLIEDKNGNTFTCKVNLLYDYSEISIGLYIKEFASHIPNLLQVENIYTGKNPSYIPLFRNKELNFYKCKDVDLTTIFTSSENMSYTYYITRQCSYNLLYFFGTNKGKIDYNQFVGFSFGILVGLQTLHRLGIWHRDLKADNILLCDSPKEYKKIRYMYNDISWTISYKDLNNQDIKIIDFGESKVLNDIISHCKTFKYEVTVALVNVFDLMWKNVTNKTLDQERKYQDLKSRLKNCTTTVLDAMINCEIYSPLIDIPEDNNTLNVDLLPF